MSTEIRVTKGEFWTFYIVLVFTFIAIGFPLSTFPFRVDVHENGHLEAYHAEMVHAERVSDRMVRSQYLTINGAEGGYRADMRFITKMTGGLFALAVLLYLLWKPSPLLSALPTWGIGAWVGIRLEMVDAGDIRNLQTLTGDPQMRIINELTVGAIFMVLVFWFIAYLLITHRSFKSIDGKIDLVPSND